MIEDLSIHDERCRQVFAGIVRPGFGKPNIFLLNSTVWHPPPHHPHHGIVQQHYKEFGE